MLDRRRFLTLAAGMALGLFAQVGLLTHLFSLLVPALGAQAADELLGDFGIDGIDEVADDTEYKETGAPTVGLQQGHDQQRSQRATEPVRAQRAQRAPTARVKRE